MNITKSSFPNPVKAGNLLHYEINISNSGDTDAIVTVIDDFDDSLISIINYTSGGINNGSELVWENITIPYNSWIILSINASVNDSITNGTVIYNNATCVFGNTSINATARTTVISYILDDPKIAIDENGPPLAPGDVLTYKIWINNTGIIDVENGHFVDEIPANTTYVPDSVSASFGYVYYEESNNTIIWDGSINAGASLLIEFSVVVGNVATGTIISNQGMVTYDGHQKLTDDPGSIIYEDPTNVTVSSPELHIIKTDSKDPVEYGDFLNYTIEIKNDGEGPAYNVIITEHYDNSYQLISTDPVATNNSWSFSLIAPGETEVIHIYGKAGNDESILNRVDYTSSNVGNGSASETTTVLLPSIYIEKSSDKNEADIGELVNFTIKYSNNGKTELTNISIIDTYPGNMEFVSATPAPTIGNNQWIIASLQPRNGGTIKITMRINSSAKDGDILTNRVNISCNEGATSQAEASVTISHRAPVLHITKTSDKDEVASGGIFNYTITVTNDGNANATGVIVTDVYSNMITILDSSNGTINGSTITWHIDSIKAGESVNIIVKARAKVTDVEMQITNYVNVTCNENSYDEYTLATTLKPAPTMGTAILEIEKIDNRDPIYVNGTIRYEIRVTNVGDGNATNITVLDSPDEKIEYLYSDPSGNINGSHIEWNFDKLSPGERIVIYVYMKAVEEGIANNTAIVTSNESFDRVVENTTIILDNETPQSRKVFHGEVQNVSMWGLYLIHYIPKTTYITLKSVDYPIPGASGVNHTYYRIWKWNNDSQEWELIFDWKEYYGENIDLYSMRGYGKYEIEFYAVDRVGNRETMEWNDVYVYED